MGTVYPLLLAGEGNNRGKKLKKAAKDIKI